MATLGSHGRGKKKSKRKNASGNRAHGSKWKAKTAEKEENKQMFEQESQKSEEKAKEFETKESNKLNESQKAKKATKAKKPKESKEFTEAKQSTEATESKETKEPKESKESKESSESTQSSNNNNNNNNNDNNNDNNNFDDVDSTVKLLNEHLDRRWNNMLALNKKRKSKRKGVLRYNKLTIYYWLLNDFNHNIGQQKDYQIEIFKQLKKSFANKSDVDQRWNAGDYVRREWMYQGGKKFETNCFDSIEHCLELVETFEPLYKYYK